MRFLAELEPPYVISRITWQNTKFNKNLLGSTDHAKLSEYRYHIGIWIGNWFGPITYIHVCRGGPDFAKLPSVQKLCREARPVKSDRFVGQQLYRTKCGYQIRVHHVCCTYLTTTLCSAAPQTCHLLRGGLPCIFGWMSTWPNLVCPFIRECT